MTGMLDVSEGPRQLQTKSGACITIVTGFLALADLPMTRGALVAEHRLAQMRTSAVHERFSCGLVDSRY